MGRAMKIFAVVPTYNRPQMLVENINRLLGQSRPLDTIIIVDNASEASTYDTFVKHSFDRNDSIKYLRLDKNVGASGGFCAGIELALSRGAEWLWIMDDDAFPEPTALQEILKFANDDANCYWSNCDKDAEFPGATKEVKDMMFVGAFFSKSLVKEIGLPRREFYMYYDDIEYSNRIIQHGGKIIKIRDSLIVHDDWRTRGISPFIQKKFLGIKATLFNGDAVRLYYMTRNEYFIRKRNPIERVAFFLRKYLASIKYFFFKRESFGFMLKAIEDARAGRLGKRF